jgi:hypothetical protein
LNFKPQTEKQGRIIEKTALFIIKNGAQMEVKVEFKTQIKKMNLGRSKSKIWSFSSLRVS